MDQLYIQMYMYNRIIDLACFKLKYANKNKWTVLMKLCSILYYFIKTFIMY